MSWPKPYPAPDTTATGRHCAIFVAKISPFTPARASMAFDLISLALAEYKFNKYPSFFFLRYDEGAPVLGVLVVTD
jgi:hypothetical protein